MSSARSSKPGRSKPSIFIMVDMEGISGITQIAQVMPDQMHYSSGRKYLTWDVNACVDGCFRGGAGRVVVRDAHFQGFNLIWDELDERAEYIQGRSALARMPHIDEFNGLILLGYHTMAGTPQGILEHTMSSRTWQNVWMNGQRCGEIAIDAGIAGDHGVPTIMVSGDDKTCAEATEFLKNVVTVPVKEALDLQGGQLLSKERAHVAIRDGTARAVRQHREYKPYCVSKPVTMRVELVSRGQVPVSRAGVKVLDGHTYEVTANTVEAALNQL